MKITRIICGMASILLLYNLWMLPQGNHYLHWGLDIVLFCASFSIAIGRWED